MRYLQPLQITFVGLIKKDYEINNKTVTAYKVKHEMDDELCYLKCNKETYNKLKDCELYTEIIVTTQLNDDDPKKMDYRIVEVL